MPEGLGRKHVCSQCQTKFYDLNKPEPACPKCGSVEFEEAGKFAGRRAPDSSRAKRTLKRVPPTKPAPEREADETFEEEEEEAEEDDEESENLDLDAVSDEELDVAGLEDEDHSLADFDDEDSDDLDARDAGD